MMNMLKAALVGILASAAMYVVLLFILKSGLSPISTPPETAFFQRLGIVSGPGLFTFLMHLFYGAVCSMIYVHWLNDTRNMNIGTGLVMGVGLWLFMMVFYGPVIGWGFFGFAAVNSTLPAQDPLYLSSAPAYIGMTLSLHLIYGTILGWVNPVLTEPAETLGRHTLHRPTEEPVRLAA